MPSLRRFLELSPRYLHRFGVLNGTDVLLRTIVAKLLPSGRPVSVRLPGLRAPLVLRSRSSDVKVFHQVFVDREHDVKRLAPTATTIIDAGANVGFSSVFFATEFPGAQVIAIEPEPSNYAQLVRNTASYPNITPVHAALWSGRGVVSIENPESEEWAFRVFASDSTRDRATIPATGVADVLAQFGLSQVDILKIDIEGAETEVFGPGCDEWLGCVRNLVIELHDYLKPGCSRAVHAAATRVGFAHTMQGEFTIFVRNQDTTRVEAPTA